ncbi:MAG: hypothetical protein ACM3OB_09685 [Acidobacteriota bacterium]
MSLLAALPIALVAVGLGLAAGRLASGRIAWRPQAPPVGLGVGVAFAAGLAALHVALYGASIAGWRWSDGALACLGALGLAALVWGVLGTGRRRGGPGPGWGDVIALVALAVLAWHALELRIVLSDFVYHWGLKGEKFFLHRGVDWSLLHGFGAWRTHPDYPTLLPELFALTAILRGGFAPEPMMVWSVVFALALVAAGRDALGRGGAPPWAVQAGTAACGLLAAGFALSHGLVGGADWIPAWSLLLALPALTGSPDQGADWRIGAAAAVAAAGKMEGVPLGFFLVAVHLLRALRAGRMRGGIAAARTLARAGLLPALVVLPWIVQSLRLHLFQATNSGAFSLERLGIVGRTLADVVLARTWYGLPLLLLAVPWLLGRRRVRSAAIVLVLQCLFILYAWASPPIDTELLVRWSADRLFFQLLPGLVVLILLEAAGDPATRLQAESDAAILSGRSPGEIRVRPIRLDEPS